MSERSAPQPIPNSSLASPSASPEASPTAGPSAGGNRQALFEAAVEVVRKQVEDRTAEREAEEARRREQSRVSPIIAGGLTILLAVGVYVAVEQPAWLFPPPPPVESREVQEASLRIGMATTAQRIERFRIAQGRLPRTLAEAGSSPNGITYEQREGDRYLLQGANGAAHLTLNSGDSLGRFVGNSFQILAQRVGR
jgi:hypothetical protein